MRLCEGRPIDMTGIVRMEVEMRMSETIGHRSVGIAGLVCVIAGSACATSSSAMSSATMAPVIAMSEAGVVDLTHTANAGEVEAAQLAAQRSSNDRVRQFAQQMITDHVNADQRL